MPPRRSDTVAENVRAEMARSRTTQEMLAAALGIKQQNVSRRLAGVTPFSIDELDIVARVVNVPAEVLLRDEQTSAVAS